MSVIHRLSNRRAQIDLATVRETIALMRDDMEGEARLTSVRQALDEALALIDALEPSKPAAASGLLAKSFGSRFVPWSGDR